MLYEVEVIADGNSPLDLNRVFDLLTDPQPVLRLLAPDPHGADIWCDVVGWDNGPAAPAQAALSEDSGEGVIMLIYGGADGIRLKPADDSAAWDIDAPGQWGEPCLMLGSDVPIEYAPTGYAPTEYAAPAGDFGEHPH